MDSACAVKKMSVYNDMSAGNKKCPPVLFFKRVKIDLPAFIRQWKEKSCFFFKHKKDTFIKERHTTTSPKLNWLHSKHHLEKLSIALKKLHKEL